jgi:exopolyphosphatase/guanosine-5'-triphosphate,3'-diphosphate pyrophosphatase
MPEKVAIIDLGTNTCNLLICEVENSKIYEIYKDRTPVKLGCDQGIKNKLICPEAIIRTVNAIKKYKSAIINYRIPFNNVKIIATAAVRNAANKDVISEKIKSETGFSIDIIDGNTEAELIYYGAKATGILDSTKVLIMDIGGGSTEFIICNNDAIFWKKSFKLGVAALLQEINPSDPMTCNDIKKTIFYLKQQLEPLYKAVRTFHPEHLIGTSGAFKTLTNLILYHLHQIKKPAKSLFYQVDKSDFETIHKQLMHLPLQKRLKMKGMEPYRAEYMPISTLFIKFVMKNYHLHNLIRTSYGIKEGAAIKYFGDEK